MKKPKQKNTTLGVYDHEFNSFATVDPSVNHKLGEDSTILHELVHMRLTQSTSYGFLIHILFKLGKHEPRLAKTADVLQLHMLHVQEGLAVFYEMILLYEKDGKEACLSYLVDMKETDLRYYNYFKPLEFLILEHDNISIFEKLELAQSLAVFALSGELKRIRPFVYKHRLLVNEAKKDTSKFALELIPDVRFKYLIKTLEDLLHQKRTVSGQVILEESRITTFQYTVSNVTDFIEKIIGEHELKNRMMKELNNLKAIDPEELYLWVHPTSLKSYKNTGVDLEQVLPILRKGDGAIVLGTLVSAPPFEQLYLPIFMDYNTKTNYGFLANKTIFIDLLRKTPLPLTVTPSAYKTLILQEANDPILSIIKRPLYVYVDVPYVKSSEQINFFLSDKSACIIMPFEKKDMSLLVIKPNINEDVFILQLFFNYQENYIIDHIESGGLKAKLLFENEDNINHDFLNSEHHDYIKDYDQIIKSIIQEGGTNDRDTDTYRNMIQNYGSLEALWRAQIENELNKFI